MKKNSLKIGFLIGYTILFVSALVVFSGNAYSGEKAQTVCPVMGSTVNKSLYVDHGGNRIYVCCGACVSAVKSNPEKYIEQLEAQGVKLEKTP
ncbi:MAG: hypothetical protein RBU23_06530 [Candidatus Auribacterota bacterium]|jgi:YHS domain-containing protein|nr:hypothetical protein [Candidatus Auribacterota bacterium]